jgi:hypothetical protein
MVLSYGRFGDFARGLSPLMDVPFPLLQAGLTPLDGGDEGLSPLVICPRKYPPEILPERGLSPFGWSLAPPELLKRTCRSPLQVTRKRVCPHF